MRVTLIGFAVLLAGVGSAPGQYYGGYYDNRASTPAEGAARGMSDIIRSQGQYNLATSAAAINVTEAQRRHIENREKWTNTYFQMRAENKAYRAAASRPKATMEDTVRWAQAGKPKRLSPSELDVVSGKINWPMLLQTDRFAKYRTELESLFTQRATAGATTKEVYWKISATTKSMLNELKGQISEVPPMDYTTARRFVQSLAYEARLPAS